MALWHKDRYPHVNHYKVSNEVSNYVHRILRAAANTQVIIAGLTEAEKKTFNQGVLFKLKMSSFRYKIRVNRLSASTGSFHLSHFQP